MGVFPDFRLRELAEKGIITTEEKLGEKQIQPSSIDLRLEDRGFCIPHSCLPPASCTSSKKLRDFFKSIASYEVSPGIDFLHRGTIYVFKLAESLALPAHMAGRANPKSSSGRTDIHTRLITLGGNSFDDVPAGYHGELWVELYSRSFDLEIHRGLALNQLRLFDKHLESLTADELETLNRDQGLMTRFRRGKGMRVNEGDFRKYIENGRVALSALIHPANPGYVARTDAPPVDLARVQPASRYFNRITLAESGCVIGHDGFYIMSTAEALKIPNGLCAELADIETGAGELRVHYAGFFDPGFHAQPTLEIRNYGHPFLLKDGQRIASAKFYPLREDARVPYGTERKSHYQGQRGPTLAKYFDIAA